jgi:hypothetical protein
MNPSSDIVMWVITLPIVALPVGVGCHPYDLLRP